MAPERSTQVTVPLSYLMIPDPPSQMFKKGTCSVLFQLYFQVMYIFKTMFGSMPNERLYCSLIGTVLVLGCVVMFMFHMPDRPCIADVLLMLF